MKVPTIKLPPQYQLPESMFDKHVKQRKQHHYRVVNNSIRMKNSDINTDQVINTERIEIFFKEELT